jgi:hypothetical protein
MEHGAAVSALIWMPPVVIAALVALELASAKAWHPARRLRAGLLALPAGRRLALLMIAITAVIHAALIPAHSDEPVTAVLFGLFTLGAVAVMAGALLGVPGWRVATLLLLAAAVVAYAGYLLLGIEHADGVGITTKVVEVAAIGLVAAPRQAAAIDPVGRRLRTDP